MVLRYLTVQQMKEASRRWVEPGEPRTLLEGYPQTRGLLGDIQQAHDGLLEYLPIPPLSKILEQIRDRQQSLDDSHDGLLRGSYRMLTAHADFAPNKEESKRILQLRDTLFPNGLNGTQLSFREQSGAAQLLEQRMTDEVQSQLKQILVSEGQTLLDKVLLLISIAKQLGVLEDQKEEAAKTLTAQQGPSDGEVRRSHLRWMQVVRALEGSLRIARPGKEVEEKILGAVRTAAALAEEKHEAQKAAEAAAREAQQKKEDEQRKETD